MCNENSVWAAGVTAPMVEEDEVQPLFFGVCIVRVCPAAAAKLRPVSGSMPTV